MGSERPTPRVIVVGAGFGGLSLARRLKRARVEVVVVDRVNYHLFQPLLYQVATGVLSPGEIAPPIRAVLRRQRNSQVVLAEVTRLDLTGRSLDLVTDEGERRSLGYDYLVLAPGAHVSYFGHDEWAEHVFPMKSLDQALGLRAQLLRALEAAAAATDENERREWLTFVVVGAGPTGVELAGQIAAVTRQLGRDFHALNLAQARIVLADGTDRVLESFAPALSGRAEATLVKLGVELRLGEEAVGVDAAGIDLRRGDSRATTRLESRTLIWTAGVQASPLAVMVGRDSGAELDRHGRVKVNDDCSLAGHPEVFVIGDASDHGGLPGLCEPAMQEGWYVARLIRRRTTGSDDPGPFRYRDLGTMATIGPRNAVCQAFGMRLSGIPGKLVWAFVHIAFLVGWGNRFGVLARWLWAIFARSRGERLILGPPAAASGDQPASPASDQPASPASDQPASPTGGEPPDRSALQSRSVPLPPPPGKAPQPSEPSDTAGGGDDGPSAGREPPASTQAATGDGNGAASSGSRWLPPSEVEAQRRFRVAYLGREEGDHPRVRLLTIQFRLGNKYLSVWWLLPLFVLGAAACVGVAKAFYASQAGQGFLATWPCVPPVPHLKPGVPQWVIWTHLFNFFFMLMVVRAGLQILADHPRLYTRKQCTPQTEWLRFRGPVPKDRVWTAKDDAITLTPLVGLPGGRHTIGIARHWHFLFDILFVANGAVFIGLSFATGYWQWLVPTTWRILPQAGSCAFIYSSLHHVAGANGFYHFNAIQQLSYFAVIFVLAPLAVLTGLAMSPALDNRFRGYQRLFGNRQIARSLHFVIMLAFVVFYAVHMTMVVLEGGFARNLNHIVLGNNQDNFDGFALFALAVFVAVGLSVWAVKISWTHTRVLQRASNATVGRLMDLLFDRLAPRAEYGPDDISPHFWPNGLVPTDPEWKRLADGGFADYRLRVGGLVESPAELSLRDLKDLGEKRQTTMHNCIQGWSGIAEWGGVPFSRILDAVQPRPDARWVMFYSYGEGGEGGPYYDSHSIHDLRHPQSILAWEMNGEPLPVLHGAPLRLRVENQLGFKQVKWIREVEFVRHFSERFEGQGGYNEDHEFYGYRDEI